MRFARRTDANHAEIRDGLRECGFEVEDNSGVGHGVPDLCVLINERLGISLHLEVKDPKASKASHELTKAEQRWARYNGWNTRKVFTLDEALAAIHSFRKEVACIKRT